MEFETKIKAKFKKRMAVVSRTDFIQGHFAFKTKSSGSYKTNQAPTKKNVSLSETARKWMSLAVKFTEKGSEICL